MQRLQNNGSLNWIYQALIKNFLILNLSNSSTFRRILCSNFEFSRKFNSCQHFCQFSISMKFFQPGVTQCAI